MKHLSVVRLFFALISLVLLSPVILQAQGDTQLKTASQQELDVLKVLLKQEASWNRGDLETYVRAYKDSPDTVFVSNQVNHGFAGLLTEYRRDYPTRAAMGTLGFSDLEVHPLGENFATCIGKYHLDRNRKEGGPSEGYFSLVLEKTDQGWKIILDHTT
jgi:ketosteroid isomerase-like protein